MKSKIHIWYKIGMYFLMACVIISDIYSQNDTLKQCRFFASSGLSFNTYIGDKFKIATHSPLLGFAEIGVHQNISNRYSLLVSVNYQPFWLKSYYKEFYDRYNWTSVGIKASYLFHKLNFTMLVNRTLSHSVTIGAGIGLSYTMDSQFILENFGCAYPYGSVQYENIRRYYYSAFSNDDKGVIIYRVLQPYLNFNVIYKMSERFSLRTDVKYELSNIPANHNEWSLFRITPITLGILYWFN